MSAAPVYIRGSMAQLSEATVAQIAEYRAHPPEPEPDHHQFEAAADELRKARMVAWLAQDRALRASKAAIRRARKLHLAEMREHPEAVHNALAPGGAVYMLNQLTEGLRRIDAQHKEHQALLVAPVRDPLFLLSAAPTMLAVESKVKKQARDRARYVANKGEAK